MTVIPERWETKEIVTELRFGCSLLKNPIRRDKCWVKGKIALLRKPAILGRKWTHVPKNQLPIADQGARAFKGEFQGCTCRGRREGAMCRNSTVSSDSRFEIGRVVV